MLNESLGVQRRVGSRHFKAGPNGGCFQKNSISVLLGTHRHLWCQFFCNRGRPCPSRVPMEFTDREDPNKSFQVEPTHYRF